MSVERARPSLPMRGGQPIRRGTVLRYGLWPALSRAGLRRVNTHSSRHSFEWAVIMSGAPVTAVQSLLGHSSPAVMVECSRTGSRTSRSTPVDRLAKGLVTDTAKSLDTLEVAPKANTA
jgi:hypothetical protein